MAPEYGLNDYEELDLKGKIIVIMIQVYIPGTDLEKR